MMTTQNERLIAEETDDSPMKRLLQEFGNVVRLPKIGEVITGRVLETSRNEIRVDIGGMAVGVIRGEELYRESQEFKELAIGDEIEATVIEQENERGEIELSLRLAGHRKAWDAAIDLQQSQKIVDAVVTSANKGGVILRIGSLEAFLPVSQLNPDHYPRVGGGDKGKILEKLRSFIGQTLSVRVLTVDEAEEKVIVSERAVWEEEKKQMLARYAPGQEVEGVITSLALFGAFVKFDSVEGLIHISEIAWERINHPKDALNVGDTVRAKILSIVGAKIFLSLKRLKEDPWNEFVATHKLGDAISGAVVKIAPYGLIVELTPAIRGLAHVSELSDSGMVSASSAAAVGDVKEFEIIALEAAEHRIGLRLKGVKKAAAVQSVAEEKSENMPPTETASE